MGTQGLSYHIPLLVPLRGWPCSAIPISGCRCGIGKAKTPGGEAMGKVVGLGMSGRMRSTSFGCAHYLVTYLKPLC